MNRRFLKHWISLALTAQVCRNVSSEPLVKLLVLIHNFEAFKIMRVRGGSHGHRWHFEKVRPPSRETLLWKRWMVPMAAAVVAD